MPNILECIFILKRSFDLDSQFKSNYMFITKIFLIVLAARTALIIKTAQQNCFSKCRRNCSTIFCAALACAVSLLHNALAYGLLVKNDRAFK